MSTSVPADTRSGPLSNVISSSPSRTRNASEWSWWTCGLAPSSPGPYSKSVSVSSSVSASSVTRRPGRSVIASPVVSGPATGFPVGGMLGAIEEEPSGRLRRAPLPFGVLVPRRRLASRGARRASGGARLPVARSHRPRRRLRLARVRACRQARRHPADHRRRGDDRGREPHSDALCESGQGVREPLPDPHRRPCRDTPSRAGGQGAPAARRRARDGGGAERGARLPVRLRARRARAPRSAGCREARRGVRPRAVLRRAAAAVRAGRREAPRDAPRSRRAPRRRDDRHRQRPRPRAAAHAAPGRARRDPLPHLARRLRAGAAREPRGGAAVAGRDGRALRRHRPRGGGAHRPSRRAPDLRPHRGARLPLPRLLRPRRPGDPASSPRSATTRSPSGTAQVSAQAFAGEGARTPGRASSR